MKKKELQEIIENQKKEIIELSAKVEKPEEIEKLQKEVDENKKIIEHFKTEILGGTKAQLTDDEYNKIKNELKTKIKGI